MISSVSGPHFLPLELNFAHLFLLFSVSPENLDPVDFGAGGRGEAFKSAAPGLSGEQSVLDYSQKSVRFEVEDFQWPRPSRQPSRVQVDFLPLGPIISLRNSGSLFFRAPGPSGSDLFYRVFSRRSFSAVLGAF